MAYNQTTSFRVRYADMSSSSIFAQKASQLMDSISQSISQTQPVLKLSQIHNLTLSNPSDSHIPDSNNKQISNILDLKTLSLRVDQLILPELKDNENLVCDKSGYLTTTKSHVTKSKNIAVFHCSSLSEGSVGYQTNLIKSFSTSEDFIQLNDQNLIEIQKGDYQISYYLTCLVKSSTSNICQIYSLNKGFLDISCSKYHNSDQEDRHQTFSGSFISNQSIDDGFTLLYKNLQNNEIPTDCIAQIIVEKI